MFGRENTDLFKSKGDGLKEELTNDLSRDLNHDLAEKEAADMTQEWLQEVRRNYPTPESAARNYRDGHWTLLEMQAVYTNEEIGRLLEECERLEAAGE